MGFEFATSIRFQFGASRYITGLIGHQSKNLLSFEFDRSLCFSISSVSIYYGTQSDIRVKSDCRLNLLRASVFNYERLDILRDTIEHRSQKLLSLDFS